MSETHDPHQAQIEDLAKKVGRHESILVGDFTSQPPKPGVMTLLQNMVDKISDPKSGNEALDRRTAVIETTDARRLAVLNGAKLLTVILFTVGGTLLGLVIAFFTMVRTH
jgi:hypothetical protein